MRVLLSVTDKTGVADFARGLHSLGAELISTGGTARLLRDAGIPVREVSDVTGFPEMLDGRVKTMHPKITGAILAMRGKPDHMAALSEHSITPIDMVVVNLYQFEKIAARADASTEDLIENIDIGGPTMIRSAAKNWQDVAIVTSASDYQPILVELRQFGALSRETKWCLACDAFRVTADYDRAISARLAQIGRETEPLPPVLDIRLPRRMSLRYGENPHQQAALYSTGAAGIAGCEHLHGKELSYNNLVDLDACWQLVNEFSAPAAAIIKHTNPAGCGENESLAEAYRQALACDPVSAFGGVIGLNREVDEETAGEIAKLFVEAIAAPSFSAAALAILKAKKNLRLVKVIPAIDPLVVKSISGGSARFRPRQLRRQNLPQTHRTGMESARIRLESGEAREIERNCLRARRADGGRRGRADEPRRFGEYRGHQSAFAARWQRRRLRRLLPVPGWSRKSRGTWSDGLHPARRLGERWRRNRGSGQAGRRDGVHRCPPLPPLKSFSGESVTKDAYSQQNKSEGYEQHQPIASPVIGVASARCQKYER